MGPEKAGRLATSIPREEECQENQGVARLSSYSAQGVSCRKAMRRQSNSTPNRRPGPTQEREWILSARPQLQPPGGGMVPVRRQSEEG